jgi:hypothetical protein
MVLVRLMMNGEMRMLPGIDHISIKSCESRLKEHNEELSLILELNLPRHWGSVMLKGIEACPEPVNGSKP